MDKTFYEQLNEQLDTKVASERLSSVSASLELMKLIMEQSNPGNFYKEEFEKYYERAQENWVAVKNTVINCMVVKNMIDKEEDANV